SFKIRGAYHRIARLEPAERAAGVVAASAGNHAQGVALAASLLGVPSTIFMPATAPFPKVAATRGYGAEVVLVGAVFDDCLSGAPGRRADGHAGPDRHHGRRHRREAGVGPHAGPRAGPRRRRGHGLGGGPLPGAAAPPRAHEGGGGTGRGGAAGGGAGREAAGV